MRSQTLRASASLVLLLASALLAHADGPAATPAPAAQDSKPAQSAPAAPPQTEIKPAPPAAAAEAQKPEPAKPAAAKPPGTAATVVNMKTLEGIMGKAVRSRAGNEDMGHIVDVLVDAGGDTRAAVIDFGGFLGVGSRKVAVAWKTLDFADSIASGSIKVALTRDQVRQAPEYKVDEPIVILEGVGTAAKEVPAAKEAAPAKPETPAAAAPAPEAPPAGHNQDSPAR
ncbi:PRC-barrel domain-containing protein (fragment) [Beijerinckiaceae bacterium RH AL1]